MELCIIGSGDEEEILVDATNRSPTYQAASMHITAHYRPSHAGPVPTVIPRAVQSLEERLKYGHPLLNFDTRWDE
jgi:hypothetical protein